MLTGLQAGDCVSFNFNNLVNNQSTPPLPIGTWEWEPKGDGSIWSPDTYRLHATAQSDWVPCVDGWLEMIHSPDRDRCCAAATNAMSSGSISINYRVKLASGRGYRWLAARGAATAYDGNKPTRLSGIVEDITDRQRRLLTALKRSRMACRITGIDTWPFEALEFPQQVLIETRDCLSKELGVDPEKRLDFL